MKRTYLTLFLLMGLNITFAQQELERANAYFQKTYYTDAIPLYEQLVQNNRSSTVLKNLADSYYRTFDMQSAARWYKVLVSKYGDNLDLAYYFNYSQSLKAIGKYEEAHNVLKDVHQKLNDPAAIATLEQDESYLGTIRSIGERYSIRNLSLNTPASEFGAARVESMLIYSAARKRKTPAKKTYRWNNQGYLDLYMHPFDKMDQNDGLSENLPGKINTKMHEGTFAITKDQKILYFTRNNYLKGKKRSSSDKINNLKIYRAEWSGKRWEKISELPFNSNEFSTEHPALNHDGSKLFFSSDRPGGHGSFDLYSVDVLNGTYGNPINLGPTINTDQKEQFPFLDSEDNLYFSSNGHPGFGLLDIFVSKYESESYAKPDNLGLPLNSGYDDFSITLHSEKHGFFASNRPNGKGSDDIYSFEETKPLVFHQKDKETIKDIPEDKIPDIRNTDNVLKKDRDRLIIKTEQIHFDYNLWYLRNEAKDRLGVVLDILQKYPNSIIEVGTHTDSRGNQEYNRELSQKRANAVKEFLVGEGIDSKRIIAKGYGESQPLIKCETDDECTEEDHELNRRCEFVVIEGI